MSFNKITLAAAALSMMSWMATPVFAGHNPLDHGHGHKAEISGTSTKGTSHHRGTKGHGNPLSASDNTHSNKDGATRGLDRANQVAGSHGEKGRENASAHHSNDGDSSHDANQ
ncbi:MAG: hypothetical protein ACREPW_06190 [Candidatus Binataceae bacterium]